MLSLAVGSFDKGIRTHHFASPALAWLLGPAAFALAAGGILAMLADTMMPEAFEEGHNMIGLVTVAGFLAAFVLTKLGG